MEQLSTALEFPRQMNEILTFPLLFNATVSPRTGGRQPMPAPRHFAPSFGAPTSLKVAPARLSFQLN